MRACVYVGQSVGWSGEGRSHLDLFVGIADSWIIMKRGQYQGKLGASLDGHCLLQTHMHTVFSAVLAGWRQAALWAQPLQEPWLPQ